ncbi:rhomboid family intramembrane serine protease [Marinigracilibium pacificum]|uniref:Rhomboid family intramembrane serine protease n=1 Tax=Marinigracilibium pacificum TaxID=2729599 RepID=A0A848J474_9BACT|nr:rhomboid family intramembrane serine protease [Marinigracilibium pacificum]NMM50305.1 rhomboid family intramembrane serine protease [Marinigracilibium pacificum]
MFGRLTPVVKNLLLINVLVFFAAIVINSYFRVDINDYLGLYYIKSDNFKPFQFVTYMFAHAFMNGNSIYLWHILGNMFALFIFGPNLERTWGPKNFLIYYMVCGIGAGLIQTGVMYAEVRPIEKGYENFISAPTPENFDYFVQEHVTLDTYFKEVSNGRGFRVDRVRIFDLKNAWMDNPEELEFRKQAIDVSKIVYEQYANIPTVGASGAVFGILLAFGMLFPNVVLMLIFPPIPIKAKYFVMFYGAYELYSVFQAAPNDNVAHFAHIGGMLFGYIMIKYWNRYV